MLEMTEGFYYVNHKLCYGAYPPEHVNGKIRVSALKQEKINTDKDLSGVEYVPHFYDNHHLTEQELTDLKNGLSIIADVMQTENSSVPDFSAAEKRLGTALPEEIVILSTYLSRETSLTRGKDRFLTLDEIYIDDDVLVFYKSKRTPIGISLNSGLLMRYYKKEWSYSFGDDNFLSSASEHIVGALTMKMPYILSGTIHSELCTAVYPKSRLMKIWQDTAEILTEYNKCGNVILYGKRSFILIGSDGGRKAHITAGSTDRTELEKIKAAEISVIWNGS